MRKIFHNLHLWLSLPFGIIFSIICLTGALLVFEKEITQIIAPEMAKTERPVSSTVHTVQTDRAAHGGKDYSVHGKGEMAHSKGEMAHGGRVLSGHDGKANAAPAHGKKQRLPFFQTVFKLHRWLLDAPAKRGESSVGKMVVGVSTIMMVIVLVSGLIIWVPRSMRMMRHRMTISVKKGWRRFIYDSHVALGFYVTLLLLIMALTGLTWSFTWYREVFVALFDGIVEPSDMRRFIFSLHTGSWGGFITRTLYFLSAMVGAILPWSGYYLWFKKCK